MQDGRDEIISQLRNLLAQKERDLNDLRDEADVSESHYADGVVHDRHTDSVAHAIIYVFLQNHAQELKLADEQLAESHRQLDRVSARFNTELEEANRKQRFLSAFAISSAEGPQRSSPKSFLESLANTKTTRPYDRKKEQITVSV